MIKIKNILKKLFFKIFTKRWNTIIFKNKEFRNIDDLMLFLKKINTNDLKEKYIFQKLIKNAADPFLHEEKIFYEKLNWPFIKGYIESTDIKGKKETKTFLKDFPHTSFPTVYKNKTNLFLLTESQSWSYPFLYKIDKNFKNEYPKISKLKFEGDKQKLIDPFIFYKNGIYYLFGTNKKSKKLLLFYSKSILGSYKLHKNITLKNQEKSYRSGGQILKFKNEYFRISQRNENSYGDGLDFFKIEELSTICYKETFIDGFSFKSKNGPHTISINNEFISVDFFKLYFDPIAKIIRLIQLINPF